MPTPAFCYWFVLNIGVAIAPARVFSNERPPNIVSIIADNLGWTDVDFRGGKTPKPQLAKLLSQGVELSRQPCRTEIKWCQTPEKQVVHAVGGREPTCNFESA